jgi:predicted amidohydrolase
MNIQSKMLSFLILFGVLLPAIPQHLFQTTKGKVKAAMCQIFCLDGDRSGNLIRIENAVREAKQAEADIVCFPEAALLGWVNPEAHGRAHPIPGENSDILCKLAEKYKIHLCIGLAEKDGDRLYDSVILIDDAGKIRLKHRKINILTELMTPPYTPGEEIGCVETKLGTIGLLICADTFKKEIIEEMAGLKPDLVLVPYGWAAKEEQWPQHGQELRKIVAKAALTTKAPVVGVDLVGEIIHGSWTGMTYGGQSVAADANGEIIAIASDRDREVKIVEIFIEKDEDWPRLPPSNDMKYWISHALWKGSI